LAITVSKSATLSGLMALKMIPCSAAKTRPAGGGATTVAGAGAAGAPGVGGVVPGAVRSVAAEALRPAGAVGADVWPAARAAVPIKVNTASSDARIGISVSETVSQR
jgi:hypothetical protein